MVQPLLEAPSRATDARPVSVPPPIFFKPLSGIPSHVSIVLGPYERAIGDTSARKAGLRYEEKVQRELTSKFGSMYWPAPYVHFRDGDSTRFARTVVPDGIMHLECNSRTYIFEIKAQHTPDAWWQLTRLYRPIIQERDRSSAISCIEICRVYDPATPFPCRFDLLQSIDDVVGNAFGYQGEFGVLPWRM